MISLKCALQRQLAESGVLTLKIRVRPGARETVLTRRLIDGSYQLHIAAQPEAGRANQELIRFFLKELNADIDLLSGKSHRCKIIRVRARGYKAPISFR